MAKKDERFEVGDLVRIIDKENIQDAQVLTDFKKYEIKKVDHDGDLTVIDDRGNSFYILQREFDGIEKVVKYPVKQGDRIRITHGKDRVSYYHAFSEGEVVTVLFVNSASITAEREETGTRQSIHHGDFEPEHMPSENDLDAAKRAAAELSDEERAQIARAYFASLDDAAQLDLINRLLTPEAAADDETEDADGLPEAAEPEEPKAVAPYRPKVGDRVKVTRERYDHGYPVGKEFEISYDDGGDGLAFKLDGKRKEDAGGWIDPSEFVVVSKEGEPTYRRPKVGDRVKVTGCENGHMYDIGKEYEITHDDGSRLLPFNLGGRQGAPNWIGEHEFEIIEKVEDKKRHPKVGDRVRVIKMQNGHGYKIGEAYTITHDDGHAFRLDDAKRSPYITPEEFEVIAKVEDRKAPAKSQAMPNRRPTVGDTVRILSDESDHEYEIGSEHVIVQDDHDWMPYRMKGGHNHTTEDEIEVVKYREDKKGDK